VTPTVLAGKLVRVLKRFRPIMKSPRFLPRDGALSLALAACVPCAFAQSLLPDVVISASRTEQRVRDALPATTLITREEIERAQTPDLPTLLQRVAGLELAQNGGPGTVAAAFIRGAESRHTLVLVDGMPVNNLNFGTAALEHLPVSDIDHIEIVRGNVSSLYGSAALGGVIQIFTRQAGRTPQASVTAQTGSRGLAELTASGAARLDSGTRLRASVESLRDKGFNATRQDELPGTNPDRDGYRRRSASLAVTQELGGDNTLGLRLRDARGTTQYDSQFGPATQADESHFAERGAALEGRFKLGSTLGITAAVTSASDNLDAQVTAFPFFVNSKSQGAQVGLEWQAASGQKVTGGVEHTRQSLTSDTVYTRSARTQDSARLGYTADIGPHQLQLNVRQDRYTDFGTAATWLAAYGYRLTEAWRVSAMASTGFNAPTFNDLYYPFGGNPLLRPEHVKSAELGVQYAVKGQEVRATLFNNRFTDLFGFDSFFNRINIGHARTRGLELTYAGRIGRWDMHAGLTSQDPVDLDAHTRLARRATTLGHLAVSHDIGPWQLGGNLRYSGSRPDAGKTLASYAVLDLTGSYTVSPQVKVFGRIDNAFNRDYETVFGYRQPGRGAFVGVTWQPKI
jgi:vitamin B12 transporter